MISRAEYDEYLRLFHARDYAGVLAFYCDDLQIDFFGISLRSAEAMQRFYEFLHSYIDETIAASRFAATEELVAVEACVRIEGLRDLSAETLAERGYGGMHPIAQGQVIEMEQFLHYRMRDGKIASVVCAMV